MEDQVSETSKFLFVRNMFGGNDDTDVSSFLFDTQKNDNIFGDMDGGYDQVSEFNIEDFFDGDMKVGGGMSDTSDFNDDYDLNEIFSPTSTFK